jgi:hypothetical protein
MNFEINDVVNILENQNIYLYLEIITRFYHCFSHISSFFKLKEKTL